MNFKSSLSFKKESDSDLLAFGLDVVLKTHGKERYQAQQPQVNATKGATQEFQTAISNASDGGHSLIVIRKQKRLALEKELTVLVKMLELAAGDDFTFITDAGFKLQKERLPDYSPLPKPVLKYIRQGVLSGSMDGEAVHFPKSVREIAVEYSTDGGLTWHNGTYTTGKRFSLKDLESKKDYLVRICYQGTRQRVSDWSEAVTIFLL